MTPEQFEMYQLDWMGTFEAAGMPRAECIDWLKNRPSHSKPRVRVKMGRQRLDSNGLKVWDPVVINYPWLNDIMRCTPKTSKGYIAQ